MFYFMLQWLVHHHTHSYTTTLKNISTQRCERGFSHFLFPFNTRLTLCMTIIFTTQTFTSSLAAASLPPGATKQRTSHLLLLLNDRNKSHRPLLSPFMLKKGGEKNQMGKLTNTCISGRLLPLTSSVCVHIYAHTHLLQIHLIINPRCPRCQQFVTS